MDNVIKVETQITYGPFCCVVCGYHDGVLRIRRETDDQWRVMQKVDEVFLKMQQYQRR